MTDSSAEPPEWTLARISAAADAAMAQECSHCHTSARTLDTPTGTYAFWVQHERHCPNFVL